MPTSTDNSELALRLEELEAYDILNTPPEQEFDDIVLIASEACGTPVSLVSLVEEKRQWFKARIGFESCDTPIEQSVCAHSLASPELLIIPDLTLDPRTRRNTLVTGEPHIRFYAGAPLISPDGVAVGTLCVIDTEPRPEGLTRSQQSILAALARQVMAHLEGRRLSQRKDSLFRRQKGLSARIRNTAAKTLAAQEAGRVGTFEVDIATGVISVSPEFCRIFRIPFAQTFPAATFEAMVLPSDVGLPSTHATRAEGTATMNVEYRIRTADEGIRWISRHATLEYDQQGTPIKMLGAVQDITDLKRSALRTQALLELGDRLRDLDDIDDMALAAADLMGKALGASRAGFGIVDLRREVVDILPDWCAQGFRSVAGPHLFNNYLAFLDDLKKGETVIVQDVSTDPRVVDHAGRLSALGARSIVISPVLDHGKFNVMAFVHHDEPSFWTEDDLAFVRSFGDRVQIAISGLQAEAEQATLNREISHRLKNTFAMVQAIATQTLRSVTDREPVKNFEKRLLALSKAHDILIHEQGGASIRNIVESLRNTITVADRLNLDGPEIVIGPRGALSLSLLLHELGTNALKYGALSQDGGVVTVRWSTDATGSEPSLRFSWREAGGPETRPPKTRGFGSKLIQLGLIGTGGVSISYDPQGFSAEMSASLHQLKQPN